VDEPYAANRHSYCGRISVYADGRNPCSISANAAVPCSKDKGWRTLAVCFGPAGSRLAYCFFSLLAYLEPLVLWSLGGYGAWVMLPLVTFPLALRVLPIVLTHEDEPTLEPMTARAAMLTFVYARTAEGKASSSRRIQGRRTRHAPYASQAAA